MPCHKATLALPDRAPAIAKAHDLRSQPDKHDTANMAAVATQIRTAQTLFHRGDASGYAARDTQG